MENLSVKKLLKSIQDTPYPVVPRPSQFRVSSLPFCQLVHVLDKPEATENFESGFYFAIGHALHNLWQNAAKHQMPKSLIGNWYCNRILKVKKASKSNSITRCNRRVNFTTYDKAKATKCLHSKTISKAECHASQHFDELEFEWNGLSGHTDFLYKDKHGYHLVDFKTTSLFLFDNPGAASKYYPSKKYLVQLETYVLMIERKHKIKIKDYTIAYISRDRAVDTKSKPALRLFSYDMTNVMRKKRLKITKTFMFRHKLAKKWLKNPNPILGKKMWEKRPCLTKADYMNQMKPAFFKECPHLDKCLSGKLKHQFIKPLEITSNVSGRPN